MDSSPRRSSPERCTRAPWHITQFRSKIGATFSLKKSESDAAAPRCCAIIAAPIAQSARSLQALSVKLRLFIILLPDQRPDSTVADATNTCFYEPAARLWSLRNKCNHVGADL